MGWRERLSGKPGGQPSSPTATGAIDSDVDEDALLWRGRERLAIGDAVGAESTARLAIRLYPYSVPAHVLLAFALIGQNRGDAARDAAERAIVIGPEDASGQVALASAWLAERRLSEGELSARRAVAVDPGSADAHYVLGTALEMREAKDEAQVEFELALELEPVHEGAVERILNDWRAPIVGAVTIAAFLSFHALRILGGRFTDRTVAVLLLLVTATLILAVLIGLRQQRRRLARLSPYAMLVVRLESHLRRVEGRAQLIGPLVVITAIVLGLATITVLFAAGQKPTIQLKVGDCFSLDRHVSIEQIAAIPCQLPHDIEVFAILSDPSLPGAAYPGLDALHAALRKRCEALYPGYVGVPFDRNAPAQIRTFVPEESYWVLDIRWLGCGLSDPSGRQLVGSLRTSQ
jgi:hypothetical protein